MAIFDDIMTVIDFGDYELVDLLHRIDIIYIGGSLSDDERESLYELAREHADPEKTMKPFADRIEALELWQTEVNTKIAEIEEKLAEPSDPDNPGETPPPEPEDEYPPYVQPTGAHDAYHNGDKITWNEEHYICIAPEGVACVWDPGTYPSYWQKA